MLNRDWATSARRTLRRSSSSNVTVRDREIQPFSWAMELLVRQVQVQIQYELITKIRLTNKHQIKLFYRAQNPKSAQFSRKILCHLVLSHLYGIVPQIRKYPGTPGRRFIAR